MQAAVALGYDEVQHAAFFFSNFFQDSFFAPDPRVTLESFTYEAFMAKAQAGETAAVAPIMFPDLLVGR